MEPPSRSRSETQFRSKQNSPKAEEPFVSSHQEGSATDHLATRCMRVVRLGSMVVSKDPTVMLHTPTVSSAVAVVLFDPELKLAGLLHFLMPDSTIDPQRAAARPELFGDTGWDLLLYRMSAQGGRSDRLKGYAIGGADLCLHRGQPDFALGQRNATFVMEQIEKAGILIAGARLGGVRARRIAVEPETGSVRITETPAVREGP